MFLTAFTDPDGALVLKSWRLSGSGLTELDTHKDASRVYDEVSMAGPLQPDIFTGHRAVTAARTQGPELLVHGVWGVDPASGEISLLGELAQAGIRENIEISPFLVNRTFEGELFTPAYYATAFRTVGELEIRFYRVGVDGGPVNAGVVNTGIEAVDLGVAPLGVAGVMTAVRDGENDVQLVAWDARRNANGSISPDQVSSHDAPHATSLDLAQVPSTHAEGDYVTAVTDPLGGALRLRAYRSGDRPY